MTVERRVECRIRYSGYRDMVEAYDVACGIVDFVACREMLEVYWRRASSAEPPRLPTVTEIALEPVRHTRAVGQRVEATLETRHSEHEQHARGR